MKATLVVEMDGTVALVVEGDSGAALPALEQLVELLALAGIELELLDCGDVPDLADLEAKKF